MTPFRLRARLRALVRSYLFDLLFDDQDAKPEQVEPKPVEQAPIEPDAPLISNEALGMIAPPRKPTPRASAPTPLVGSAEERLARMRLR
jgi:hypothetical protein